MPISNFIPRVIPYVYLEVVVDLNNFSLDSGRKGLEHGLVLIRYSVFSNYTLGVFNRDLQLHLKSALLVLFEAFSLLSFDNCATRCLPSSFFFAPVLSDQIKSKAFYVFLAL